MVNKVQSNIKPLSLREYNEKYEVKNITADLLLEVDSDIEKIRKDIEMQGTSRPEQREHLEYLFGVKVRAQSVLSATKDINVSQRFSMPIIDWEVPDPSSSLQRQVLLSDDIQRFHKELSEWSAGQRNLMIKAAIDVAQKESGLVVGSKIDKAKLESFIRVLSEELNQSGKRND